VRHWIRTGRLPTFKVGRMNAVRRHQLNAALSAPGTEAVA
jgi:hypothetical protein